LHPASSRVDQRRRFDLHGVCAAPHAATSKLGLAGVVLFEIKRRTYVTFLSFVASRLFAARALRLPRPLLPSTKERSFGCPAPGKLAVVPTRAARRRAATPQNRELALGSAAGGTLPSQAATRQRLREQQRLRMYIARTYMSCSLCFAPACPRMAGHIHLITHPQPRLRPPLWNMWGHLDPRRISRLSRVTPHCVLLPCHTALIGCIQHE
jgi:hypothetical protein